MMMLLWLLACPKQPDLPPGGGVTDPGVGTTGTTGTTGAGTTGTTGAGATGVTDPGTGATGATGTGDPGAGVSAQPAAPAGPTEEELAVQDVALMLKTGNANNAQAALEKLTAMVRQYPSNPYVQYNLGVACWQLQRVNEARDAWVRATSIDPKFGAAWLNLGGIAARDGKMDIALQTYQSGIRNAPDDMDLRAAEIAALRDLKRTQEAIEAARKALAINSNALGVYTNLALVYLDTGQIELARFIVQKAQRDVPRAEESAQLQAILGEIFYRQGYKGSAVEQFKKALELDPALLSALMFLSGFYLDNRNYSDALPLLERAAGLAPKSAGVQLNLGIAYRGMGRMDEAKACYDRALALDPRNPEPHRNLAILYGDHLKKYEDALQEIDAYKRAGGATEGLDAWIEAINKDIKRRQKEEERKKKDEARKQREAEEAAAAQKEAEAEAARKAAEEEAARRAADEQRRKEEEAAWQQPPAPQPQPEPQPQPPPTDNPWGQTPPPTEPPPAEPQPQPDPSQPSPWN